MTAEIPAPSPESNPATNDAAAAADLCGMTHLPTGRVCTQPARHTGSCEFQLLSDS